MTIQRRELYRSSNGDRWLLARDIESGEVFVGMRPTWHLAVNARTLK
jgi:hypothetical protein